MISQKKLEANRRNAAKSTGPKTEAGKEIAKMNGVTHGLTCAQCSILPGEDEDAFRAFHKELSADLKPRGIMQREIVDDIVQIRWKLRRIARIEATMMQQEQDRMIERHEERNWQRSVAMQEPPPETHPVQVLATRFFDYGSNNPYERMELYRQRLTRAMHTSLRELRKLREETGNEDEFQSEKPNPPRNESSPSNNHPGQNLEPETPDPKVELRNPTSETRTKTDPLPTPSTSRSPRTPGYREREPKLCEKATGSF